MANDFTGAGQRKLPPPTPMAVQEMKMGLEPIENLLDERQRLVDQVAELRAQFGSWGVFDHQRKIELSQIKQRIRLEAMRDKIKLSNDAIDDMAHADAGYVAFIVAAQQERARWVRTEERINHIDFLINRGQSVARYATAEVQL
jgi:chorismate mutase